MKFKSVFLSIIFLAVISGIVLPGMGQEQPCNFIMLADPQFGLYEFDMGFSRETANYEFAVAAINRLKPAFVIVLGDLVNKNGDEKQISEFLRISRKIDPSIPIHYVAGNHDVGYEPTPETLAAYRQKIGPDYYSFRSGPVYGIVLNSVLFYEPRKAEAEFEKQNLWLKEELEKAKASGSPQIIIFQHHPFFLDNADEPFQFWNIPPDRRKPLLELLHKYGVNYVFAGHLHRNSTAKDKELEMTGTGSVGMPLGPDDSGIRLVSVTAAGVQHGYFTFGRMPDRLELK
jgi:3',5'-cyclic AMP phosphodiesterase CpdA